MVSMVDMVSMGGEAIPLALKNPPQFLPYAFLQHFGRCPDRKGSIPAARDRHDRQKRIGYEHLFALHDVTPCYPAASGRKGTLGRFVDDHLSHNAGHTAPVEYRCDQNTAKDKEYIGRYCLDCVILAIK